MYIILPLLYCIYYAIAVTAAPGSEQTSRCKATNSPPIASPNDFQNADDDDTSVIEPEIFNQLTDKKLKPASMYCMCACNCLVYNSVVF